MVVLVVLQDHFGFILSDRKTEVVTPNSKTMWSPVQLHVIDESSFNDFKIFLYELARGKTRINEM